MYGSRRLSLYRLPAQLFLCLGGLEQVRCQFCTAHVIQNLLALFQAFPAVNVFLSQPAIKAHVTVILKNGVVYGFDDTRILGRIGQLGVMAANLFSQQNPPLRLNALVGQFLPPRLDRKVGLTLRHDLLVGVGVLNDEVAGIAGQKNGLDRPLPSLPDLVHIGDVNEMILEAVTTVEAGHFGLLHDPFKIAVVAVAQGPGKITA